MEEEEEQEVLEVKPSPRNVSKYAIGLIVSAVIILILAAVIAILVIILLR